MVRMKSPPVTLPGRLNRPSPKAAELNRPDCSRPLSKADRVGLAPAWLMEATKRLNRSQYAPTALSCSVAYGRMPWLVMMALHLSRAGLGNPLATSPECVLVTPMVLSQPESQLPEGDVRLP